MSDTDNVSARSAANDTSQTKRRRLTPTELEEEKSWKVRLVFLSKSLVFSD
jgi:hypothetical protein